MVEVNRTVLHSYPKVLRESYAAVLKEHDLARRHAAVVRFAEAGLALAASIALSDYRSRRWNDPSPRVEDLLAKIRRPSMGHFLELMRDCMKETRPAVLDSKQADKPESLRSCARLQLAMDGVQDAIDLEARNISRVIGRRLDDPPPQIDWLRAWELVVAYRNRAVGHASAHAWPVEHPDFFGIMTPIVESAAVELLVTEHLERVLLDFPVGRLIDISYDSGSYHHAFDADDQGVPARIIVSLDRSVGELYAHPAWRAELGHQFLLARTPSGAFELRALFHDVQEAGFPEPIEPIATSTARPPAPTAVAATPPSTSTWKVGQASAPGTCGELVQGITGDGHHFHITCPIRKTATVSLRVREAQEWQFEGVDPQLRKAQQAVRLVAEQFGRGAYHVNLDHWSDLHVGKGMGSSTADIVASARAMAQALEVELSADAAAKVATTIESSDGSMYPGLVAFRQREGTIQQVFEWWPQFAVVMVVPPVKFNTESADFAGKERLGSEFDQMLTELAQASESREGAAFGEAATRSASLNQRYLPNPWYELLYAERASLGASGVNVGHTGTVAGLLFEVPDADPDLEREAVLSAGRALRRIRDLLPSEVEVELTMTPRWSDA